MTTIGTPTPGATLDDLFARAYDDSIEAQKPVLEEARLHWFNGLIVIEGGSAIGWHIRKGIDPRVDETLSAMGTPSYTVQHKTPGKDGSTDPKPYWALKSCSLVFLAVGVQSMRQMNKTDERLGIAFAWAPESEDKGQPKLKADGTPKKMPVLKLRACVAEMALHGYYEPLPLTLSGYIVDEILVALTHQFRALDYYHELRLGKGRGDTYPPFFSLSLPLTPARQPKMVGEPPNLSPIYPMLAEVPDPVTTAYLQQHLVPQELWTALTVKDEDGLTLVEEAVLWSAKESATLAGTSPAALEGPEEAPQVPSPAADLLLTPEQVSELRLRYCGNREDVERAVCQHYGVTSLDQLRRSQYTALMAQVKQAR